MGIAGGCSLATVVQVQVKEVSGVALLPGIEAHPMGALAMLQRFLLHLSTALLSDPHGLCPLTALHPSSFQASHLDHAMGRR